VAAGDDRRGERRDRGRDRPRHPAHGGRLEVRGASPDPGGGGDRRLAKPLAPAGDRPAGDHGAGRARAARPAGRRGGLHASRRRAGRDRTAGSGDRRKLAVGRRHGRPHRRGRHRDRDDVAGGDPGRGLVDRRVRPPLGDGRRRSAQRGGQGHLALSARAPRARGGRARGDALRGHRRRVPGRHAAGGRGRRGAVRRPSLEGADPTPRRVMHLESAGGRIVVERDVRIRMRDGVHLSADVYRPDRPGRFGALLEHIPYRKDDLRALQDRGQNLVLAEAGFACVRLDVRGTGSSEGVAIDEYTEAEQLDGVEVVEWIARQDWCNGNVGSWGKSYGGFSCIQLAARRPRALRAIAPVYATDDRYTDDMHYDGGAVCAFELSNYPIRMIGMNALPPGEGAGPDFDARWRERIDSTPAWVVRWLTEQQDGPYWRNGSLRPDYERIECPVFIVSGWHDGYRTAGLRMARRLRSPWQLLAGPWTHVAPDRGVPGPVYPFMRELIEFFRTHLDPGSGPAGGAARPRAVVFIEEHDAPDDPVERVSGEWFSSESWPGAGESVLTLGAPRAVPISASVGLATGNWC